MCRWLSHLMYCWAPVRRLSGRRGSRRTRLRWRSCTSAWRQRRARRRRRHWRLRPRSTASRQRRQGEWALLRRVERCWERKAKTCYQMELYPDVLPVMCALQPAGAAGGSGSASGEPAVVTSSSGAGCGARPGGLHPPSAGTPAAGAGGAGRATGTALLAEPCPWRPSSSGCLVSCWCWHGA